MNVVRTDLGVHPLTVTLERSMTASPAALYRAWTAQFDRWFAAPGTLIMRPQVNVPYFFETHFNGARHAHQVLAHLDAVLGS